MRTIVWMCLFTLFAATAVYGLEISSRHSALANVEIEPGLLDLDSGDDHGGIEPFQYAR